MAKRYVTTDECSTGGRFSHFWVGSTSSTQFPIGV